MRLATATVFALLGANILAQTNAFVVFPLDPERVSITCASYVRRPANNNQAEAFQEINTSWFRGVGEVTGGAIALGFYHWAADENIATAETYGLILRTADTVGRPDNTPAGVILQVNNLSTPSTPTGGPRGSWIMTDTFATPAVLPTGQTWFQGVAFPANPNWPATDGHSLWAADSPSIASPATTGENHRVGAPLVTWFVDANNNIATTGWTYLMGVVVPTPVLHVGGIDATSSRTGTLGGSSYGMNGLFPDISGAPRRDGIDVRLQDGSRQGLAFAAGALGFQVPAFPIPGIGGQLNIDIVTMTTLGFASLFNGAARIPVALPNTLPPSLVGHVFAMQGVVVDATTFAVNFTNAQATSF
jgi:hypothetical protein